MKPYLISFTFAISLLVVSCKSNSTDDSSNGGKTVSGQTPSGVAYQVDIPRSEVKWSAFKPTGTHSGIVPVSGGTIYINGDIITGGTIEINIAALEVRDLEGEWKDKLEGHLKGTTPGKEEDFFNVNKYPTATFTVVNSSKLENDPVGTHMINGQLRMKDITKPVSFKAKVDLANPSAIKATTEPFMIDRTEWDIKFQSRKFFSDLKDDFVNDEIKLEIILGALRVEG